MDGNKSHGAGKPEPTRLQRPQHIVALLGMIGGQPQNVAIRRHIRHALDQDGYIVADQQDARVP